MTNRTTVRRALAWAAACGCCVRLAWAEPFSVDLAPAANTAMEDDGIAGNGQGGWTDEGINDMFLWPALPVGDVVRNGYHFRMLDSAANGGHVALRLRVGAHQADLPRSARVVVPDVKGRFVYFVHHSIGGSMAKAGDTNAVYTITYADGTEAQAPMVKGRHLHDWWCRNWYDNSEADAWPVHMGINLYTMKWHSLIGLWATQWTNPHPEKPIRAITFASLDKGGPVIWAVTIDDADYRADPAANKGETWKSPGAPPAGYFDRKIAIERGAIFAAAVREGMVEGVRRVELIRADLLAVTVDPALTRATDPDEAAAAAAQRPETFTVTSPDDAVFAAGLHPRRVGRDSYEEWNGTIGTFVQNAVTWHTYYLELPRPLHSGSHYTIRVAGIAAPFHDTGTLDYDDARTPTAVIKVNQVAYSARATRRYAYLGWWAADLGAVDYAETTHFAVVSEDDGSTALEGAATPRADAPGFTGEQVYEMNLSALKPGRYHIRIPGLGCSAPFGVGGAGIASLYRQTQRAFYHQRCGFPLQKPFTTFEKPACHLWVYESGKMVDDASYRPEPGEAKREYRGGYHDAADFDCFTYHLRATAQDLDAFDMTPALFRDGDLNIPESGNKIPDLLDEAEWALRFYREQQAADGGVPKGRCNDQDSRRQPEVKWGPFGIFKPDPDSNFEYAATAASFARLYKAFDARLAETYLASAAKAFDWAMVQPAAKKDEARSAFTLWAAGALYRATGEARYQDAARTVLAAPRFSVPWKLAAWGPLMRWPLIRGEQAGTDPALRARLRQEIIRDADGQLSKRLDVEAYRYGGDSTRGLGWGTANGGGHYADILLRAWWLTGEQKYLDGASINADFQLGCNPLSKTFITGMGARPPRHPQIAAYLYEQPGKRGGTVQGITVYGLAGDNPKGWYPAERPKLRRWRDLGNGGAEVSSEFTITETIGASAMLYASLYAEELRAR